MHTVICCYAWCAVLEHVMYTYAMYVFLLKQLHCTTSFASTRSRTTMSGAAPRTPPEAFARAAPAAPAAAAPRARRSRIEMPPAPVTFRAEEVFIMLQCAMRAHTQVGNTAATDDSANQRTLINLSKSIVDMLAVINVAAKRQRRTDA